MKITVPILVLLLLVLPCLLFFNCAKIPPPEKLQTRLMITLKDDKGLSVAGTVVRLYKNAADTGIVRVADSSGILYYPDLDVAVYSWLAEKGCKNNRASQTTLNRPLVEGFILYGYAVLSETGTLKITNNSAEAYKLFDSTFTVKLPADTIYFTYPKVGRHKIRVEKISTPGVGKDSIIQIKCSDTVYIKVPF